MSREFLRLYRGIGDGAPRETPESGLRERLRVLNALGYETGFSDRLVAPPRHHGRAARRRGERPRRPALPPNAPSTPRRPSEKPSTSERPEPLDLIADRTVRGGRLYGAANTAPRERNAVDKSYSSNKWSTRERERLIEIFGSTPAPSNPALVADFHRIVATRFVVFFPSRELQEVEGKIVELKRRNQLGDSKALDYRRR